MKNTSSTAARFPESKFDEKVNTPHLKSSKTIPHYLYLINTISNNSFNNNNNLVFY